jgi:hypothetical protein
MFINKKQQLVIIGHINDSTIINNLTNNGFLMYNDNKNLYFKKDNSLVLKEIVSILKEEKPEEYIYLIKIDNELVILEYKKVNQNYYFYKVDKLGNGYIHLIKTIKYLQKNLDRFVNYRINRGVNILYCILGGVRTIDKTYDKIYHNVIRSFYYKESDIYLYLKANDLGPKNNGGVNFVYHSLDKDEIIELVSKYHAIDNLVFSDFNLEEEDIEKYVKNRERFINWMSTDDVLIRIMNFHYNLLKCGEWILEKEKLNKKQYDYIFYTRPDIDFPNRIPFYLNYSNEKVYDLSKKNFNDFAGIIPRNLMDHYLFKPFELYENLNNCTKQFFGPEQMLSFCIGDLLKKTDYFASIERKQDIKKYNICFMLVGSVSIEKNIEAIINMLDASYKYYNVYVFGYINCEDYDLVSKLKKIKFTILKLNKTDYNYWLLTKKCFNIANIFSNKKDIQYDLVINMNCEFKPNFFIGNEIFYCIKQQKVFFNIIKQDINLIDKNFIMGPYDKMTTILNYYNVLYSSDIRSNTNKQSDKQNNMLDKLDKKYEGELEPPTIDKIKFTFYLYNSLKV